MLPIPARGAPAPLGLPIAGRGAGYASADEKRPAAAAAALPIAGRGAASAAPGLPIAARGDPTAPAAPGLPIAARGESAAPAAPGLPIPARGESAAPAAPGLPIAARGEPAALPIASRGASSTALPIAARADPSGLPIASRGNSSASALPIAARADPSALPIAGRGTGSYGEQVTEPEVLVSPRDVDWRGGEVIASGTSTPIKGGKMPSLRSSDTFVRPADQANGENTTNSRFLDLYSLGEILGQGAFGIVYLCRDRSSEDELAVKMVDKVETPFALIRQEAELQKGMDHPNIVKVYTVFHEPCFVCIIMDLCRGGDLILAIQEYWDNFGSVSCGEIVHVCRQMLEAVCYLHSREVVHRDVKGDNFLLDTPDFNDPSCRIALGDFGSACRLKGGRRLEEQVGTRAYWSPEIFDMDYGSKVDVWAIGVIVFGLLEGELPFSGERSIREKDVVLKTDEASEECTDFVLQLLQKRETQRLSAADLLRHPWLAPEPEKPDALSRRSSRSLTASIDLKSSCFTNSEQVRRRVKKETALAKDEANIGVRERRQELVRRLESAAHRRKLKHLTTAREVRTPMSVFCGERFETQDQRTGSRHIFAWWKASLAEGVNGLKSPQTASVRSPLLSPTVSSPKTSSRQQEKKDTGHLQVVGQMLADHGIDTSRFGCGDAKTLEQFAEEVHNGISLLMLDATEHKKLVRVVDIVLLRLTCTNEQEKYMRQMSTGTSDGTSSAGVAGSRDLFLVESSRLIHDGSSLELNRLPGTKKEPHESTKEVAERILNGLGMAECNVEWNFDTSEVFEEELDSDSYPGMLTVYRKEIIEGYIVNVDSDMLQRDGCGSNSSLDITDRCGQVKNLQWLTEAQCLEREVQLAAPTEGEYVSCLVRAPVGLEEEALGEYLKKHGVDLSRWGGSVAREQKLEELADELIKGESAIIAQSDGSIKRVVDVVLLRLVKTTSGDVLIEESEIFEDDEVQTHNRYPGGKRRPDENQFLAAKRLLKKHIKVDPNCVSFDKHGVMVVEEESDSHSFPGLRTLYRKRIISAQIQPPSEMYISDAQEKVDSGNSRVSSKEDAALPRAQSKEKTPRALKVP